MNIKSNKTRNIIVFSIIVLLLITLGVSYAMYGKSILGTKDTKVIAGDIYMRYINGETKEISMTPSDTYNEGDYYEFTISGKNTSNKDIVYDITLNHGENYNSPYIRLNDKFLRFRLVTVNNNVETLVDTSDQYPDITNKKLYVGTIPNTNNYNVTYRLYVWVNGVIVGNVNQDYTSEQWSNVYTNIKVSVTGDFVEREADGTIASKFAKLSTTVTYIKNYTTNFINKSSYSGYDTQDTYLDRTRSEKKDVYYFTGDDALTHGNVLFGGFCWQIIRTTDTGGIKLIYNGVAENDKCLTTRTAGKGVNAKESNVSSQYTNVSSLTNFGTGYDYDLTAGTFTLTGTSELAGKTWANNSSDLIGTYACSDNSTTCSELWYIGHYYSLTEASVAKYVIGDVAHYSQTGTSYYNAYNDSPALVGYMYNKVYRYKEGAKTKSYYANSVKYENESYILQDAQSELASAPSVGYKYVCDDTATTSCNKVRFYYYNNYYVLLEQGDTNPIYAMLNGKTQGETIDANINVYNSSIKGYLDNWYKNNIVGTSAEGKIDTSVVYCNDRTSSNTFGSWNKDATATDTYLYFKQYDANKDLRCENKTDRFTAENSNSSAKLEYPVGLLTEPERGLMNNSYAKTGKFYWGSSPSYMSNYNTYVRGVSSAGGNGSVSVYNSRGARPVVSLRPDAEISEGEGTYESPYRVG